jgi:outer membrane protein assembly factor BamB
MLYKNKIRRKSYTLISVVMITGFLLTSCRQTLIPATGLESNTAPDILLVQAETPVPEELLETTPTFVPTVLQDLLSEFSTFLPLVNRSAEPTPAPTIPPVIPTLPPPGDGDWAMVASNPQRTSWSREEVSGNLGVEWYRPIEAYIPQNVQLIASGGLIYVATANGLYALNAFNGETVWRFDTKMPLGNSPTVANGVVYVGGYDRNLYALRAADGALLWSFSGAGAGYSTNPLVVDGKVLLGNRDGYFYAIGEHGTTQQGQLVWKYKTDGFIDISAAYADGVVYFASNDNHGYALRVNNGTLVWKSELLPGDGYQSYWPVIYGDGVIFSAASGYRTGFDPGTTTLDDPVGNDYGKVFDMDRDAVFDNSPLGSLIGPTVPNQNWANGNQVLDYSAVTDYLEEKPWRRTYIMLNRGDGREYTFDSDGDGRREYLPALMYGTHSGNRYPPIIGSDGILYFNNLHQNFYIPQGKVVGWLIGTPYMSLAGGQGAVDEPQALSAGGDVVYRNRCCDRQGDYFGIGSRTVGNLWSYGDPLSLMISGYDEMWYGMTDGETERLRGNYGTQNGIYHNHGDQNPIIPYQGKLYVHRSNAIIAFGSNAVKRELPLLTIQAANQNIPVKSDNELRAILANEIQKMIDAGLLRPGYYNSGQYSLYSQFANYFENPGETLYALALAYPHLSTDLQNQTRQYLINTFDTYFDPTMIARTGWKDGAAREWMPLPPEAEASAQNFGPLVNSNSKFSWTYPPFNFYALWKYTNIVPEDTARAYQLSKSRIQAQVSALATNDYLLDRPYEINAYIAGYIGFLELQNKAGMSSQDSTLRNQVTSELNRLINLRVQNFNKDTPWSADNYYHRRPMNISQNFLFLVPELADELRQGANSRVVEALNEYTYTAPYWFVSRYNGVVNEGVRQNLYDPIALFQAKALILNQSASELVPYLDVPAFYRGDLFYIMNLVQAIEAQ